MERHTWQKYDKKDIFNFDVTTNAYTAPLRTTMAQHGSAGWKQVKKRITVSSQTAYDGIL